MQQKHLFPQINRNIKQINECWLIVTYSHYLKNKKGYVNTVK